MPKSTAMFFLSLALLANGAFSASLFPRASEPVCSGPTAQSNNGDRKMAIVIDSSSSMTGSDPYDLRLEAGKSILDWLIVKDETSDTKKEDVVTIIDFADDATLDYGLGDPSNAYGPLANITAYGGTYIASGVEMAIEQLTAGGTGDTKDRSGILVFTDGSDSYVEELVTQVKKAADAGIRVSFGFLSYSSSYQDVDVQKAILNSGGVYFTITNAESSRNFINGILVNGLTKNDNPNGDKSVLLSGLEAAHYISGSETQTMTYGARSKEQLTFTVQSVDAGSIDAKIVSGKQTLATQKNVLFSQTMSVVAPSDGNIDVQVTASSAPKDSIFIIGVESNLPPQNCTVGIGKGGGGGSNKAKIIGPTVGVGLALLLGGLSYLLWKYFHNKTPTSHGPSDSELYHGSDAKGLPKVTNSALPPPQSGNWFKDMFKFPEHAPPTAALPPPPPPPPSNKANNQGKQTGDESGSEWEDVEDLNDDDIDPHDPSQTPTDPAHKPRYRIHRIRIYGNNHHHHVARDHPCYHDECPLVQPDHVCDDPAHPCTCVDPKCKLNSRRHICKDEKAPPHKCYGPKEDPRCPLNDPPYMEAKEKEHNELVRKYMAQDAAVSGVKMAATYGIRALAM